LVAAASAAKSGAAAKKIPMHAQTKMRLNFINVRAN
jgi:hypothetical protein